MAYIKNGEVCYDDIFDVSVIQTQAEIHAAETAQNEQRTNEKARVAARQAVLDRLGITADEAQLLFG